MIWLKSIFAGLAASLVTVIAIVLATTTWHADIGEGAGGIGFVSFGISGLLVFPAALAFALGFFWMVRRHQRRMAK